MDLIVKSHSLYLHRKNDSYDFHIIPLSHLYADYIEMDIQSGFDEIYKEDDEKERIKNISDDLYKVVKRQIKHYDSKISKLQASLEEALNLQGDKACLSFFKMLPDRTIDLSDTPDLGPVLFAVAAAKGGGAFTGIRRLRIKESDRAQAMADELAKFGVVCRVTENEMILTSSGLKKPEVPLDGHNDHRIVMALSILASITGGTILGAQAVRKSWPDYFTVMQNAGMELSVSES